MVKIRLRRVGKKKQASFRVVVADARSPRDGRFIETIGHYNPRTDPPTVAIKEDRALYWLSHGAQPTNAVARMLQNMGTLEKLPQVHQGISIEELIAPPEPEVEKPVAEVEPALEAEEVVAEAEAIVEAVAEAEPAAAEIEAPAETEEIAETAEAAAVEEAVAGGHLPEVPERGEAVVAGQISLQDLGLSTRVINVLAEAGLETAQDILDTLAGGDAEFLSIPGAGGKSLDEVREQLARHGLLDTEE